MLKIGDFSKLTQISIRMLRYYEEKELLIPAEKDFNTNYRFYHISQIKDANIIKTLSRLNVATKDIKTALTSDKHLNEILAQHQEKLENEIILQREQIMLIENIKKNDNKEMVFEVKIKKVPDFKVFSHRGTIDNYHDEQILWSELYKKIQKYNIKIQQNTNEIALFHNSDDIDIEVMMIVDESETNFNILPGKEKVLSILVYGPYYNIAKAFETLANLIEEKHYQIDGNVREIPIYGPWNKDNENDYLTEIQIPIK